MNRTPLRLALASASLGLAIAGALAVPGPAPGRPGHRVQEGGDQDPAEQRGCWTTWPGTGSRIATAGSLGVAPRDADLDLTAVPDPIPLPLLLADHRAGDQSLFVYPWC